MAQGPLLIRGAREHNLRDVSLDLPRGKLICFTGVSGSGKSSLAFDTLYAEGQRRYVESLSSYARQFLGQMPKPQVDRIDGLSPSISIQQKTAGRNPRSTVGTITEISDYLRVLYARVGVQHCPTCGERVAAQTRDQIVARLMELPEGAAISVLAPIVRGQKGEYKDLFAELVRAGYLRARVDGSIVPLADPPVLDRQIKHNIEVVIDRITLSASARNRVAEAVEGALRRGEGTLIAAIEGQPDLLLSSQFACAACGVGFDAPSPQLFSFNSPIGMCLACEGLGIRHEIDPALLVPNGELSVWEGAIGPIGPVKSMGRWQRHLYEGVAATIESDRDGPSKGTMLHGSWRDLGAKWRGIWLNGTGTRPMVYHWRTRRGYFPHSEPWRGIVPTLLEKYREGGPVSRLQLEGYLRSRECSECGGARLNARARAVHVGGCSLAELGALSIGDVAEWFDGLAGDGPGTHALDGLSMTIAKELLKEIRGRLRFLLDVGLHYLALDRGAPTLSGGEAQRIRLASQVGAGLVGVLYILDEPSIGLHPRDNERLIASLERLRDQGNTVIVVEHDEETMRAADHLVDFGPGPGVKGGEVVAVGSLADVSRARASVTGQYLAGKLSIEVPKKRRKATERTLRIVGARHNNLKNIDVTFPLGMLVCVSGVSGSGKSSLVGDILQAALSRDLNGAESVPGIHDRIEGLEHLDKIIDIDQSPIGRTPRSNPATYIKLFDEIRNLYTKLPDAKARGYKAGRFSFNVGGGRCEACEGNGSNKLEMDFLADVWVTCPVCEGKRFNRETLHVRYKGKSIADVLEMDVQEALEHFANLTNIAGKLQTLHDVGLDYIKLGQPSPTLSGGEAQRIKLARELSRRATGRTLYVLDEPTTGLHFDDVKKLLGVLQDLVSQGNTVVVIEHNLDVVKTADWVIDLGPEGGAEGGHIVAEGTPERVAKVSKSHTGKALARVLRPENSAVKRRKRAGVRVADPTTKAIAIRGARQHNLKGVDIDIPRHQFTVCCGPSGSGKSSLAIDTLYAEGQRRYVESLSSYARQFLAPLQKPKVEHIGGLAPAICIEQKTTSKSPRSTVGTVTEIYDYLRILFARLGQAYCPKCDTPIGTQTADEIVEKLLHWPEGTRLYVMAPVERDEGEDYALLWDELRGSGFARVRVDGTSHSLDDPPKLGARQRHSVEVIIDRAVVRRATRARLADSIEAALDLGRGVVHVARVDESKPEAKWERQRFSQHRSCDGCGRSFDELTPQHFSFNSPVGWCGACQGLGIQTGADPTLLIPEGSKSIRAGAVAVWPSFAANSAFARMIATIAEGTGLDLESPFDELDGRQRRLVLQGTGDRWFQLPSGDHGAGYRFQYKGLFPAIEEAGRVSFLYRSRLSGMVREGECSACMGARVRDDAAAVRFHEVTLDQLGRWPLERVLEFFRTLKLTGDERHIAGDVLRELGERLTFLVDVGLGYLSLSRPTPTLSGGEAQRIRLASQLGSGLTGVLYVLDEPTIGLHPRDNGRLLGALKRLRDLGNTLVVVEHDREVISAADYLVDFGPGAGDLGGTVTAAGTVKRVTATPASLTGSYLAGRASIPVPLNRRDCTGAKLMIRGARQHNLKRVNVEIPMGALTAVTGVSGSGKSSLVEDVLMKAAAKRLHRASAAPGACDAIVGLDRFDKVISVDQAPIGTTPASNPATYTGVFDQIRELFAKLPEAKIRGYSPGRFSFNVAGGRCEACEGNGQKRIEMHFLPDVWVTCDACGGARYASETMAVTFRGKSIADVLAMKVDAALELFAGVPRIRRVLQTLHDVGLGYVALGQAAPTMSGGEAQRVKLAAELARPDTGQTLYILDEPTTGLHADDVRKLLSVLQRLADLGNTVVVVEHNLDLIKTADWVVDLGPEAGAAGGSVVVQGSPEKVAQSPESHTGRALATVLAAGPLEARARFDPKAAALAELEKAKANRGVVAAELAGGAQMPWQVDGERWHTRDRVSRTGKPARWDGRIVSHLVREIGASGRFDAVDWSERSVVRINGKDFKMPVFFEAITNFEWIVELRFYVPRGRFEMQSLAKQLSWDHFFASSPPVPSDRPRVQVRSARGGQLITFALHAMDDILKPGFQDFLQEAIERASGQAIAGTSRADVTSRLRTVVAKRKRSG